MTEPKQLHAFADGELAPQEAHDLREALKADPRAAAEVDAILNLKDVLAKNSLRHTDDEAWKGCLRRLDAIDKTRRVDGFVGRYAWAMCGLLFVFILSGRFAMRNVQGETSRIADLIHTGGGPVSPEDQARAKAYELLLKGVTSGFDRKAIQVMPPLGGTVHDIPAVRFPVRDGYGDLTLTRVDGLLNLQDTSPMASNPGMAAGVSEGENCLVWRMGGRTWLLSGHRSLEDLGEVANRLLTAH